MRPHDPPVSPLSAPDQALAEALALDNGPEAIEGARRALALGASPNASLPGGSLRARTPLELAATLDRPWAGELALALLDAGADPVITSDASDALRLACRYGSQSAAMALLARGQSPRAVTEDGWSGFLCAAATNRFELCERLAPLSDTRGSALDGSKALRVDAAGLFIQCSNPEAALKAYRRGWGDAGLVGNSRWTPVIRAILGGWDELVEHLAAAPERDRGHADFSNETALHHAARANRADYARALAKQGDALDALDERGLTPLSAALSRGGWDCARALLDLGASPAARAPAAGSGGREDDCSGMDAICAAAGVGDPKGFELMAPWIHRADRGAVAWEERRGALHFAAGNECSETGASWIKALLAAGWDPNALDRYGQIPLITAIGTQSFGAIAALLPVSDLGIQSKAGLNAVEVAEWLAAQNGKTAPRDMISAYLERKELLMEIPGARPAEGSAAPALKPRSI